MSKKNFFEPGCWTRIKLRCVAHFYALFNIDPNVQVSDTTDDAIKNKSW